MTDVSRRAVLAAGAGTAAVAILEAAPAASAAAVRATAPIRAHFARSVGKTFTATSGRHTYHLVLRAIRDLQPTTARNRPYCFLLEFVPAHTGRPADGLYRLTRKGVPTHTLGLTSLGTSHALQAVINRPGNR